MIPLDMDLAAAGYLRSPEGHVRYIWGLDRIAHDLQTIGAKVYWVQLPGNHAGFCRWREGVVLLAPWLFWAWPWFVKSVLSHELGHVIVGPSQEQTRTWQQRLYGDLITWPEWA